VPKLKTFCKWKEKELLKRADVFADLVNEPRFVCRKCARVANTRKVLCKPMPLAVGLRVLDEAG